MEKLSYIELMRTLESLRPDEYISILKSSPSMRDMLQLYKYDLLKFWVNDSRSRTELEAYLPNLTFKQMEVLADFYYPRAESIGKYKLEHLFLNAIKAGYTDEECLQFAGRFNNINTASAYIYGRTALLKKFADSNDTFAQTLVSGNLGDQPISNLLVVLHHPDMNITTFCDLLYKLVVNDEQAKQDLAMEEVEEYSDELSVFVNSGHPDVIAIQKKLGVAEGNPNNTFDQDTLILFPNVSMKCELYKREYPGPDSVDYIQYHYLVLNEFFKLDSKLFPTYDLDNDVMCGNWIEVIHKVNTVDRNIVLRSNKQIDKFHPYQQSRLETYGQILLNVHPRYLDELFKEQELRVANPFSTDTLLEHWCFPNMDVSKLSNTFIYDSYVDYYHPLAAISHRWGSWEIPIVFERFLQSKPNIDNVNDFIIYVGDRIESTISLAMVILAHSYGYDNINPYNIDRKYLTLFTAPSIQLHSSELYVIVNSTYLRPDDKLEILSRVNNLHPDIISGIQGVVKDDPLYLIGNILNINGSRDPLANFGAITEVNKKNILPYIRSQVDRIRNNLPVSDMLPLQLIWQYTNELGDSETYEEALIYLLDGLPYDENTTTYVLTSAGQFYDLLAENIRLGKLPHRRFATRFGY